jgi:hypothetical protein
MPGEPIPKVDEELYKMFNKEYLVVIGFDPNATRINIEVIK